MNRQQAVQYQADAVAVLHGADLDFEVPTEFPCDECGAMVDLTSMITVSIVEKDGAESTAEMSEAKARALLGTLDIPPPPVLCCQHDPGEIITVAWPCR